MALTKFDDFDLAKFESMIKIYDVLDSQLSQHIKRQLEEKQRAEKHTLKPMQS